MAPGPSRSKLPMRVQMFLPGILCVVGAVWFSQGIGWLGGSFMSGDTTYEYVGLALFVVGVGALIALLRRSTRAD